jgi:hypothetical protein
VTDSLQLSVQSIPQPTEIERMASCLAAAAALPRCPLDAARPRSIPATCWRWPAGAPGGQANPAGPVQAGAGTREAGFEDGDIERSGQRYSVVPDSDINKITHENAMRWYQSDPSGTSPRTRPPSALCAPRPRPRRLRPVQQPPHHQPRRKTRGPHHPGRPPRPGPDHRGPLRCPARLPQNPHLGADHVAYAIDPKGDLSPTPLTPVDAVAGVGDRSPFLSLA